MSFLEYLKFLIFKIHYSCMCWLEPSIEPTQLTEISCAEEVNQKDTGSREVLSGSCYNKAVKPRLYLVVIDSWTSEFFFGTTDLPFPPRCTISILDENWNSYQNMNLFLIIGGQFMCLNPSSQQ